MTLDVDKFRGIFPALVTPYTPNGTVNEPALRALVSRCLEKGVRGFYVCGSTAEVFLLSVEERMRVLEVVAEENDGRGTLVAHVGTIGTDQSIGLARHAKDVGVDAVSSVSPFYYGFSIDEVLGHYLAITDAVDVPMILYNFPANSGFTLTTVLMRELRNRDQRIVGLKHTSMDLYELEQSLRIDERFVVLAGHDEVLLGALAMGAHGAVGSTFNVMPELYIELMDRVGRGDLSGAQLIQQKANSFIRLMKGGTGIPVVKAALEMLGIECNGCRRPFGTPTEDQKSKIERTLRDIGVLS